VLYRAVNRDRVNLTRADREDIRTRDLKRSNLATVHLLVPAPEQPVPELYISGVEHEDTLIRVGRPR
jgi:hypothetical protein